MKEGLFKAMFAQQAIDRYARDRNTRRASSAGESFSFQGVAAQTEAERYRVSTG
jgi:hypothetical protein